MQRNFWRQVTVNRVSPYICLIVTFMKTLITACIVVLGNVCLAQSGGIADNTGIHPTAETTGIQALDPSVSLNALVQGDILLVSTNASEFSGSVSLFDMNGRQVATSMPSSSSTQIDIQSLSTGIYLLEAPINGEVIVRKIFISGR